MKSFPILVKQVGVLTNETSTCDGQLFFSEDNISIDFEGYFEPFVDTASRFCVVFEYENEECYEIFELTLIPTSDSNSPEFCSLDFEIEKDNEFFNLRSFLLKNFFQSSLKQKTDLAFVKKI